MCLILDDREDTRLARALAPLNVQIEIAHLEFGDAVWEGKGPRQRPVLVAVERKRITDLIASMESRRLSGHQLRGMWGAYDYCYLVVEGMYRPGPCGEIEQFEAGRWKPMYFNRRGVNYRQVDSYISSLELRGGLIAIRSASVNETAAIYASRYHWWQKEWDQHHAHDELYTRDPLREPRGKARIQTTDPGIVEKIAAQLPGIDRKAWDVARRFKTVDQMVAASEKDWMSIPGIGAITASQVWKALRGN